LKIAVSGKGGAGKSTIAANLIHCLAARGVSVFAVDADPDANLGFTLGLDPEKLAGLPPLIELHQEIMEKNQGGGLLVNLTPEVDDVLENYSLQEGPIKGCCCPYIFPPYSPKIPNRPPTILSAKNTQIIAMINPPKAFFAIAILFGSPPAPQNIIPAHITKQTAATPNTPCTTVTRFCAIPVTVDFIRPESALGFTLTAAIANGVMENNIRAVRMRASNLLCFNSLTSRPSSKKRKHMLSYNKNSQ